MSANTCMFCKLTLESNDEIDVKLTAMLHHATIEEFIKESVLNVEDNVLLVSYFLCQSCFVSVNQLEEYFVKSREIQQSLYDKYYDQNTIEHQPRQASYPTKFEAYEETSTSDGVDPDLKVEAILSESANPIIKHEAETMSAIAEVNADNQATSTKKTTAGRKKPKMKRKVKVESETEENDKQQTNEEDDMNGKYCCEICGKMYKKCNAAKHRNIHTNEKMFICHLCQKQFRQKVDLKRHINIHMGIFPYQCEICGKKFAQHPSYDIHKRNHLGQRDHTCIVCGKGLLSPSHLKRHMRTHTREKNFACSMCGKTFAENYNLMSHMRKVHLRMNTEDNMHLRVSTIGENVQLDVNHSVENADIKGAEQNVDIKML